MMPFGFLALPDGYSQAEIPQLWANFIQQLPPRKKGFTGMKKRHHKVSAKTKIDPDLVGMVIGAGGSTIKRLSRDAGDHCFIKHLGEGEFQVSALTKETCDNAIASIKKFEEEPDQDHTEHQGEPVILSTQIDASLVGLVIGAGGRTIKRLSREAGRHCFIKHLEDGEFEVRAPTEEVCNRAIASIKKFEEEDERSDDDSQASQSS